MTEQEIEDWKKKIDGMSQGEMISLQKFAPREHPVFNRNLPLLDYFEKRFKELEGHWVGAMSDEVV